MAKAQNNFKIGKEQDLKDRKKGKKDKNEAYKRRTSKALKLAELRKIELSSAVSTALKQLKPAQRRKIEQEIKKQLQDEKNTIHRMQDEIESAKEKNEREQKIFREKFEREQNQHRKEKEMLMNERKAFKEQMDQIAALRKDLESQKRMMDAELNKNTLKMKDEKKRLDEKQRMAQQQKLQLLQNQELVKKEERKQNVKERALNKQKEEIEKNKEKIAIDKAKAQRLRNEIKGIHSQIE